MKIINGINNENNGGIGEEIIGENNVKIMSISGVISKK
jgi:hypothetical protein